MVYERPHKTLPTTTGARNAGCEPAGEREGQAPPRVRVAKSTRGRSRRRSQGHAPCFFFQAEDGIRDIGVTGVQTCALPICAPTDSFATDLAKGYKEVLKPKFDSGEYELAAEEAVPNWDGQRALQIFEQMLQKTRNDIDGVVAANDTLANAVITALQARDLDLVPTTGLDATAGAVQHILAGEQSMTVYFSIKDQATKAADLAVRIAH